MSTEYDEAAYEADCALVSALQGWRVSGEVFAALPLPEQIAVADVELAVLETSTRALRRMARWPGRP